MCWTLPVPESPVCINNWGLFTIWGLPISLAAALWDQIHSRWETPEDEQEMSSSLPHAHLGCYVFRSTHPHFGKTRKKKRKNKAQKKRTKKETTNMYSAGYDVNGTIAEKELTFWEKTINIVPYSFTLSACFVVFFVNMDFKNVTINNRRKKNRNNNNNIEWLPAMPFVTFVTFWIFWDTFHFVGGNWMKYRYYIIQKINTCIHICLYVYT